MTETKSGDRRSPWIFRLWKKKTRNVCNQSTIFQNWAKWLWKCTWKPCGGLLINTYTRQFACEGNKLNPWSEWRKPTEIPANPERRNVTRIEMDFTYAGEETLLIIVRPVVDTALEFRSQGNFGLHRVSGYVKNNIIDQQPNSRSLAGRPICIMSGTRFAHTVTSSYKVHPVQLVFLLFQYFCLVGICF